MAQTTDKYKQQQITTFQAIQRCGFWARKAGIKREENPFRAETSSYNRAWDEGWIMIEFPK